ncbi:MAG: hypothetical protein QW507_02775 [Candidatus Nanoarchaeia archaeon]|nr:hypothetical protein [Candidatus Haiyanarchaeum thermophilum]MCW1303315.1 hypothetical protein [Candidatus Haiyanarchaeum thermophilum]MCW1304103.1 hypothetical protein [Candidatus Haiyanarchaeum thermophilum]MCW1306474.1 hypothetical protein [Candidatus Haiyanarchaeum thermophilum]MCW1307229.1 hypothetical protein [Candidatus Haiyanarchaeum thermophilum]
MKPRFLLIAFGLLLIDLVFAQGEYGSIIVKVAHLIPEAVVVKYAYIHNVPEVIFYVKNNGSISAEIINATLSSGGLYATPQIIPSSIKSGYVTLFSFRWMERMQCHALGSQIPYEFSVFYYSTETEITELRTTGSFSPTSPYGELEINPILSWTISKDAGGEHYSAAQSYDMLFGIDHALSYALRNAGEQELNYSINISQDPTAFLIISSTPENSYQTSELQTTNFSLAGGESLVWKHSFTPLFPNVQGRIRILIKDLSFGGCDNLNKEINFSYNVYVNPGPFGIYIVEELDELHFILLLPIAVLVLLKFYKRKISP